MRFPPAVQAVTDHTVLAVKRLLTELGRGWQQRVGARHWQCWP